MIKNFDKFLYQYRWIIGSVLIAIILIGSGLLAWQRIGLIRQNDDGQVQALKDQNDLLRQQLAGQSQVVAGAADQQESVGDKININTADLTVLDKIPGIGPAIGQRIIDYRNQNGDFQTIDEIKNVKGIGDKTFEKMADLITVGE